MMVMTLDGATTGPDGLSGTISGAADKRVFMETRRLSDAVLVGAGTIRAERYRPMLAKPEWQEARQAAGLAAAPQWWSSAGDWTCPG
jgi:Pyrimidine reductase, riboflavin biosynthesis